MSGVRRDTDSACPPHQVHRPPRLALTREPVSAGKRQRVCNEHFGLETKAAGERNQAGGMQEHEKPSHMRVSHTQSASPGVVEAPSTEWRAEIRNRGGDFHCLLLRVSQQISGISKLMLLPLPHRPQTDCRYVETSLITHRDLEMTLFTCFLAVDLSLGYKPHKGRACLPSSLSPQHLCRA